MVLWPEGMHSGANELVSRQLHAQVFFETPAIQLCSMKRCSRSELP